MFSYIKGTSYLIDNLLSAAKAKKMNITRAPSGINNTIQLITVGQRTGPCPVTGFSRIVLYFHDIVSLSLLCQSL